MAIDQYKISPPAVLNDKSKLLGQVKAQVDAQGKTLTRLWVGLDPTLHLIEAIMIETADDEQQQVG